MFIETTDHTINTDQILYAEKKGDGSVLLHFADQSSLTMTDAKEIKELWGMLNSQMLPSVYARSVQSN